MPNFDTNKIVLRKFLQNSVMSVPYALAYKKIPKLYIVRKQVSDIVQTNGYSSAATAGTRCVRLLAQSGGCRKVKSGRCCVRIASPNRY